MPNNEEALNAITGLNNTTLDDNTVVVQQGQEITKPSNHPRPRR
jgi:RNA recognition motif-containing protein